MLDFEEKTPLSEVCSSDSESIWQKSIFKIQVTDRILNTFQIIIGRVWGGGGGQFKQNLEKSDGTFLASLG